MDRYLGRYEILEEIGRGAMGVIYKGRDPVINRIVALKTIRLDIGVGTQAETDLLIKRFYREAETAGRLIHPNVVAIFDIGEQGGVPYIAMEYIEGKTLAELISSGIRFSLDKAIDIISQVCAGLNYAHENNIVHRDIKPANIMLLANGQAKIADFGIAKLAISTKTITISGTLLGTPGYLSPEQIEGKDIDHRSDIFSVGAVFYELITGKKAFDGETIATVFHQIMNLAPSPPSAIKPNLIPELDRIIFKALAKAKEDRYQKAIYLAEDLRSAQKLGPFQNKDKEIERADVAAKTKPVVNKEKSATIKEKPGAVKEKPGATKPQQPTEDKIKPERDKQIKQNKKNWQLVAMGAGVVIVALVIIIIAMSGPKKPEQVVLKQPASTNDQVTSPEPKPDYTKIEEITLLIEEGKKDFDAARYDLALNKMTNVLSLDEDNEEALSVIHKIENLKAVFQQGLTHYERGEYQNAVDTMSGILQSYPDHEEAKKYLQSAQQALSKSATGFLSINVWPWGEIYMDDDRYIGEPPIANKSVPVGEHTITVKRAGYETVIKKITFEKDIVQSVSINLKKIKPISKK